MQVINMDGEYALIKLQSTPLGSYCDIDETYTYTDDCDVALIVSCLDEPAANSHEITLKYYIMLTSKQSLPFDDKRLSEDKTGKFRTVTNTGKSIANSQVESPSESSHVSTVSLRKSSKTELMATFEEERRETDVESSSDFSTSSRVLEEDEKQEQDETMPSTSPPVPNMSVGHGIMNASNVQIRQESINYMGYYSLHEQLMQQLMISQAHAACESIKTMIYEGAVNCR